MASGLTLAFIGCGNMGSAILGGILDATRSEATPPISSFIVCTKSNASADRLRTKFAGDESRLCFLPSQNVQAMRDADIILLACKPYMTDDVLGAQGVREALSGKFVISVLAGKTVPDLESAIARSAVTVEEKTLTKPHVVRAMPNIAASIKESTTIVEAPSSSVPAHLCETLEWIFQQIGMVRFVPANLFEAGTMLVGSSMGVMTVALDGYLDGLVVEGFRRADALEMMAQVLRGLSSLIKEGGHPALLRESMSSPRGCTIQGLLAVEKAGTRGAFAQAVIDGTSHLKGDKK